ncbi:MAG: RNB domain-containing ribonuclease [Betaproteobacteria bacterium]|nr:RNB domain-containing ribonuclease [Betaproteobacteria bacterium]MSQ88112.1 RNB domain-containing ribonuclease [Betaproteobacteria bacterium]
MNVLYEEEGEYKAGVVLSQSPAHYQVESPHGRRSKIKAANVVLSFEQPSAGELLTEARKLADDLDTDFLWQCRKGAEFSFQDLSRDYVGHPPSAVESAGVLLKLHSAPMYFYRRGRGRFQAAPEDTLKLALAGVEKKKRLQEQIAQWTVQLSSFVCPPEIACLRDELLYAPDRARPETKALEQACAQAGLSTARLFERCGLLADSHEYHLGRFVHEFYPRGTGFPPHDAPTPLDDLPLAACVAFSLDDIGTTEIDDAFSVMRVADDELRIGVHIAAPGLAFAPGSALDAIARERLSTAYMPGRKFTMLPDDTVAQLSLDEGHERPVVSLYLNVGAKDFALRGRHTKLERVKVAANLRHTGHAALNAAFEAGGANPARLGLAYEEELHTLWQLALALENRRGKPSVNAANLDFIFRLEGGRVVIEARKRGAPLDKLVSELMILANTSWGEQLAEKDIAGIYRVQSSGKVRLSVHAEMHEGLGVSSYAWMSSPLRRYVDLINQWQLVAGLRGQRPPFARNTESLLAALRAFEVIAAGYDEHQRAMEHYWCLRWIEQERQAQQEGSVEIEGLVLRDNLVRLVRLPLVLRVSSLPELPPGARVRLALGAPDLLERTVACAWRETLEPGAREQKPR